VKPDDLRIRSRLRNDDCAGESKNTAYYRPPRPQLDGAGEISTAPKMDGVNPERSAAQSRDPHDETFKLTPRDPSAPLGMTSRFGKAN